MKYKASFHSIAHLIKAGFGTLENLFTVKYPADELIVVNYHSTPKKFINAFETHVKHFREEYNIISPDDFRKFYERGLKAPKCSLLFTFDDGLRNNRYAAEVLERYDIKAFFFVVPDFVNTQAQFQKKYYIEKIRPVITPGLYEEEDFEALSWPEIREMAARGHAIGSHTLTHALIADQSSKENSYREIVESKNWIEEQLKQEIRSFCSINNTLLSVGSKEKELIRDNYDFHFSTLPGSNRDRDKLFIKRRNVEVFWLNGAVQYALGKWDLGRWRDKIRLYSEL